MSARYAETRHEVEANTERVKTLVHEGDNDAAQELTAETEHLIASLPKREQKRYRDALTEAGTPPQVHVPVMLEDADDYRQFEGVEERVQAAADAMVGGVKANMQGTEFAKKMAKEILEMRLRIIYRGLPDVMATSHASTNVSRDVYAKAGEGVEGDRDDVEQAVKSLMRSVQYQMSTAQTTYLRSLDENREEAEARFPLALERHPDLSPTEAVYAYYEENGITLPRKGKAELDRERRQRKREIAQARDEGREPPAELVEADRADPASTLSTDVTRLRAGLQRAASNIDALDNASDEVKKQIRQAAEEAVEFAKKIIPHTL